jgi:hypothetical protein
MEESREIVAGVIKPKKYCCGFTSLKLKKEGKQERKRDCWGRNKITFNRCFHQVSRYLLLSAYADQ